MSVAKQLLAFNYRYPGDIDADVCVPARTWSTWLQLAIAEIAETPKEGGGQPARQVPGPTVPGRAPHTTPEGKRGRGAARRGARPSSGGGSRG